MLVASLIILSLCLIYRLRRDRELLTETIDSYAELVAKLNNQLEQQKQLASELAHDLKSPISGIVASVESLQMLDREIKDPYSECLKLMLDSGRTNLRLLSNFIEFLADRKKSSTTNILPDNRKDILKGLLSAIQISEDILSWNSCTYKVKISFPLKPFASAFAEICDVATKEALRTDSCAVISEDLDQDSKILCLRISPVPDVFNSETKAHIALAQKILERLGIKLISGQCSEQKAFLELSVPVTDFVLTEQNQAVMRADAEQLVAWSAQQVHSAKLSLDALQLIKEKEAESVAELSEQTSVN